MGLYEERQNRMLERLQEKMGKVVGHRGDMYIADFLPINKRTGRLLIGYSKNLGPVTSHDIKAFVIREFEGKAVPDLTTAKVHKEDGGISLVMKLYQPTKKLEAKEKMLAVASTMFLDQEMQDTWEVKDQDGTKFLAKVMKEDLNDIVQGRRMRMQVKSSPISLASVQDGTPATISVADKVTFFHDDKRKEGTVLAVNDVEAKIKCGDKVHTVATNSILDVSEVSPAEKGKLDSMLYDYYKTIFGDDYAKMLTNK